MGSIETIGWQSVELEELVPPPVLSALDLTADAVGAFSTVLDLAASALDLIATFTADEDSVIAAILQEAIAALDSALELFENTSIATTCILPKSYKKAPRPRQLMNAIALSLLDKTDPNRPFTENTDQPYMVIVFMGVAETPSAVLDAMSGIFALFGAPVLDPLTPDGKESFFTADDVYPPPTSAGQGQEPNWVIRKLVDVGLVGGMLNKVKELKESVTPPSPVGNNYSGMAQLVKDRASQLSVKVAEVQTLIVSVKAAIKSIGAAELALAQVFGTGTSIEQAAAIRGAVDHRSSPFKGLNALGIAGGVAMHFQGPSIGELQILRQLFGLGDIQSEGPIALT